MSSSSSYELVLTSSTDGPIVAYNASTGAPLTRFLGTRSPRRGLTAAGNHFIAATHVSPDTAAVSIHLYNWHISSVLHRFPAPEFVAPLAATADGVFIFAGGQSGSIHCFSVPLGDVVKSFPVHTKPISCLQLNNDGSLVISGSDDGSITVIPTFQIVESSDSDSSKDLILHHLKKAHSDSVTALSTGIGLCNNSMLVSSSLDSTCKFWNLLEGTLLRTVTFPCSINGVAISSSDSSQYLLFAAGSDGSVYKASIMEAVRKTQNEEVVVKKWNKKNHGVSTEAVVVVNEGKNLVSASEDGSVWMWEIEREEVVMVIKDNDDSSNNGGLIMEGSSSISDMIVVSGIADEHRGDRGKSGGGSGCGGRGFVSSGMLLKEEVMRSMKKIMEVGDVLRVVEEDERRAINMLESAIAMYERLLELILEEALKGTCDDDESDEEQEKEDEDK
ncbi:hypothetical protein QN277_008875 [Acacia crassicarpa]|uniref:Uncharacterized protein n=1 Tax=Acacia crassicarpa TaxID=499986 RepID=A0AAE1JQS6_9FABA|nr:hypothetical protein QN277_008875 [Acacia crassicarpa]